MDEEKVLSKQEFLHSVNRAGTQIEFAVVKPSLLVTDDEEEVDDNNG